MIRAFLKHNYNAFSLASWKIKLEYLHEQQNRYAPVYDKKS